MKKKILSLILATTIGATVMSPTADAAVNPTDKLDAVFYGAQYRNDLIKADLDKINTDVITFGYRVTDFDKSKYPTDLVRKIPSNSKAYFYTDVAHYDNMNGIQKYVASDKNTYYINTRTPGTTVISIGKSDNNTKLVEEAKKKKLGVYLGLPMSKHYTESNKNWLPDRQFLKANEVATQQFIDKYNKSVDGFYLTTEMPVRDNASWQPVYDIYNMQTRLVNKAAPGKITLMSPYLTSRKNDNGTCPTGSGVSQYQAGMKKLLSYANGTNLLIIPQDGIGTDTTALRADRSTRHCMTTEDAFAAMSKVGGNRLLVNLEAMNPGYKTSTGGKVRTPSNIKRFDQQNAATAPYVSGKISYMWNNVSNKQEVGLKGMSGSEKYMGKGGGGIYKAAQRAKSNTTKTTSQPIHQTTNITSSLSSKPWWRR